MKHWQRILLFVSLAISCPAIADASEGRNRCQEQADHILARLQAEVVGELAVDQRAASNQIVLDVCQGRERQVEIQMEQAVQEAREEEQEKAGSWLTGSANKAGNKRLKRKGH